MPRGVSLPMWLLMLWSAMDGISLVSSGVMEAALRDRTIKIDIPYITKWTQEARIYARDFTSERVHKHVAPHTLEMAAMWAVLTRLEEPKKHNLSLAQKAKLYDNKMLPGFTEDNVKELRKTARREGLEGISPRFVQDKLSNALVRDADVPSINAFMVLNELESGLNHHSLISDDETRKRYKDLLTVVKQEYDAIVKNEVQKAITADEGAIARLCANYIDNVKAFTQKEKVKNTFTGAYEDPDERLMRAIEEKIEIQEAFSKLPRNSCPTRLNRRCEISGRSKSYYRKFAISRIALRELTLLGQLPGMRKSSW